LAADGALADCGVMSDRPPDLHMLNLVVGDMSASLDFYRRLGIAVPLERRSGSRQAATW